MKYMRLVYAGEDSRMREYLDLQKAKDDKNGFGPVYEVIAIHSPKKITSVEWTKESIT